MRQRENPTRSCADAGPLGAAASPESALYQVYDSKIENQSAMTCQKNQILCTACRHAFVRFAHQAMQP